MASDFFASEDYDHGKSCIGKEAGIIDVYQKGCAIEKFWPAARVFSHERELFVAPLSSADITRLGSTDQKILFYVHGVRMLGIGNVVDPDMRNILFAYQILRDNTVHWTLSSTIDAQTAFNKAHTKYKVKIGTRNLVCAAVAIVLVGPFAVPAIKGSLQQAKEKAEILPSMENLRHFVKKYAHR